MIIYVPSMSRVKRQMSLPQLEDAGVTDKMHCVLVVPEDQSRDYYGVAELYNCELVHHPVGIGISGAWKWISEFHAKFHKDDPHFVIVDDDLSFYKRATDDPEDPALRAVEGTELQEMMDWVSDQLCDGFAHCSIASREQSFQMSAKGSYFQQSVRPMRFYAYNNETLLEHDVSFSTGVSNDAMCDFHMTLNLLELGYPNIVSGQYAHNQYGGSNTPGGVSEYRDLEVLRQSAVALKAAHPNFVRLVEKTTKTSWGGTADNPVTRTDVVCSWKKSLGSKYNADS